MFFTEEKLQKRIEELAFYRYRDAIELTEFQYQEDKSSAPGSAMPDSGPWRSMRLGQTWSGRDVYLWLQTTVTIPVDWRERTVVGLFDFGRTGGGNNSGFESLCYLDGLPYQGVDSNHTEVIFPAGKVGPMGLAFHLWSGLEGGGPQRKQEHKIAQAAICWLDDPTDDLYFTARAVLESLEVLPPDRSERTDLLHALNASFRQVDWAYPGSDIFYASVQTARKQLEDALGALQKNEGVIIHTVGHTHIDVAWMWRLKHTREKTARSWATVIRLMERFPEFKFLQTQPQLYEYLKTDYPTLYRQIGEKVRNGQWEPGGAMWLEADCNIPSGESLVRQIIAGFRFFQTEFGVQCRYLWLPDAFGYNWALPQILTKAGIDVFVTTKISWNEFNRMEHDTFIWRGMDGSEILTHFLTTPGSDSRYTYNGLVNARAVQGAWVEYQDKLINRDLLLAFGYGDGGGGVTREMLEMRRRLDTIPGIPHVRTARADNYLARLADHVASSDQYVHTWDGELYLEYHRGTYTSQSFVKRMNRLLEVLLRETEWLSVLSAMQHKDWSRYPEAALNEVWKILLRNQFHDIIPGSSIHEVYEDAREEYSRAQNLIKSLYNGLALTEVTGQTQYSIANALPLGREAK